MSREYQNAKKRKRVYSKENEAVEPTIVVDTCKPTAIYQPTKGREWTVTVALPGSIIANAQSLEQKTFLAGNIARALAVFCVDEVVIFSDGNSHGNVANFHANRSQFSNNPADLVQQNYTGVSDPDHFLVHLLSYLETPPHLRKQFFPLHPNLRIAGTLPSLDLPHHLKADEWCLYREGVTLPGSDKHGTFVEAGLRVPVTIEEQLPAKTRVTLKFRNGAEEDNKNAKIDTVFADPVSPFEPRDESGYYWGYQIRRADSLSSVFTECTYTGGYDISIGTSERGSNLESLYTNTGNQIGEFKHLLLVFGGVAGLEVAVRNDQELQKLEVVEAKDVFDHWINICPGQGSRTIRTEEALWIGLTGCKRLVNLNENVS
ncbi:BgTH12-02355 [Blumeria graminis f. sp. triticale]|uniref:BgtA-20988 n=3 Tax=Blumeria graminis TaxID=34373 RepID=A0A9X9MGX0_BLUGR|nr:hypothetical protein BGT96224_A20988 [Blumeria graminis f. sp. tritici 96224]CAD6502114.1 BgTH12-02355 [Blumeria graminis f. sp. triticale]VDB86121.1 BgtA-20988 [Blumeria graminis f. sp. tritici]